MSQHDGQAHTYFRVQQSRRPLKTAGDLRLNFDGLMNVYYTVLEGT